MNADVRWMLWIADNSPEETERIMETTLKAFVNRSLRELGSTPSILSYRKREACISTGQIPKKKAVG